MFELLEFIKSQLATNPILVGGVGTVIATSFAYMIKSIPMKIWNFFYGWATVTITVTSDDSCFSDISKELNKKTINILSRTVVIENKSLGIGYGTSYSYFNNRLMKVDRTYEQSQSSAFKQKITMTAFFITKEKLYNLFKDYFNTKEKEKENKIEVYAIDGQNLCHTKKIGRRLRDSIFVSTDVLTHIERRIDFFLKNKEWYVKRGIPYKYSILLHGVPGTGKSSLAKYIATYTNRDMVMTDPFRMRHVSRAVSQPVYDFRTHEYKNNQYVVLMEDIDCDPTTGTRQEENSNGDGTMDSNLLLAELLNAIDGINSPEDTIIVATTNHIEKLDPALIRKGRFDDVIEIKPLSYDDIKRMIEFFFEDKCVGLDKNIMDIPGAAVQDIIIQNYESGIANTIQEINSTFTKRSVLSA